MIRKLKPEQAGELLLAICALQDGDTYEFQDPTMAAIFSMIEPIMQEDIIAYEEKCEQNRRNVQKRYEKATENSEAPTEIHESDTESYDRIRPCESVQRPDTNETDNDNDNDNDNDFIKEKPPKGGKKKSALDQVADAPLSEPMKEKLREWIRYKTERREPYKPTGLQTLITRIARAEQARGTTAVMKLIDDSMSNGWKGIIWERLENRQQPTRAAPLRGFDALIAMEEAANG